MSRLLFCMLVIPEPGPRPGLGKRSSRYQILAQTAGIPHSESRGLSNRKSEAGRAVCKSVWYAILGLAVGFKPNMTIVAIAHCYDGNSKGFSRTVFPSRSVFAQTGCRYAPSPFFDTASKSQKDISYGGRKKNCGWQYFCGTNSHDAANILLLFTF